METTWYCFVAVMIATYVVLDGFDLGAGIVHLFVARTEGERRAVLGSIGPVWDGNEVWLLAGGGTLYFAFRHAGIPYIDYTRDGRTLAETQLKVVRSEEHTSELQSLRHLVCRLLLE